jgi:hypothetical protein
VAQLLHLEHVEDFLFTNNFNQACDTIGSMADFLSGKVQPHTVVSAKYDGAPAIVFGCSPENGLFFVGTKSVFNKIPKACYNHEDIDLYYSDKPGLAKKLKLCYDLLIQEYEWQTIPMDVVQADLMWTYDSIEPDERTVAFTPNTITYRANKQSREGLEVINHPLGLVVHTQYLGRYLNEMRAVPYLGSDFDRTVQVKFISPFIPFGEDRLEDLQYNSIIDSLTHCETTIQAVDKSIFVGHHKLLKMFINFCVRIGEGRPEVSMYESFLQKREEGVLLADVAKKRQCFTAIFNIHRHLSYSKGLILMGLKNTIPYFTEVNGTPCANEGVVVTYHGIPCKFVDRHEFSKNNFANQRFAKV